MDIWSKIIGFQKKLKKKHLIKKKRPKYVQNECFFFSKNDSP